MIITGGENVYSAEVLRFWVKAMVQVSCRRMFKVRMGVIIRLKVGISVGIESVMYAAHCMRDICWNCMRDTCWNSGSRLQSHMYAAH